MYDISGPNSRPIFADAATVDGNETLQALLKQVSVDTASIVSTFMYTYISFSGSCL